MSLSQWVKETRQSAQQLDNEWDEKAVDWPGLNENSIVFEIGSFKGRWALQIAERYNPKIYCFEPQNWAWQVTSEVLKGFNAEVYNFGLGYKDERLTMGEFGNDGCSFVSTSHNKGDGEIRDIVRFLDYMKIQTIDLCLINIEGFEYVLIPYMMSKGIKPANLMIQFHDYDGRNREIEVRELLVKNGYNLIWDYGSTLSAWELSKGE